MTTKRFFCYFSAFATSVAVRPYSIVPRYVLVSPEYFSRERETLPEVPVERSILGPARPKKESEKISFRINITNLISRRVPTWTTIAIVVDVPAKCMGDISICMKEGQPLSMSTAHYRLPFDSRAASQWWRSLVEGMRAKGERAKKKRKNRQACPRRSISCDVAVVYALGMTINITVLEKKNINTFNTLMSQKIF